MTTKRSNQTKTSPNQADDRDRLPADALTAFDRTVVEQWPDVLARSRIEGDEHGVAAYVDAPGEPWRARATCDALEIAGAFRSAEEVGPTDELVRWLQSRQDRLTGLFLDPSEPRPGPNPLDAPDEGSHHEGVLSMGYALEVLEEGPARTIRLVDELPLDDLLDGLHDLPWTRAASEAGAWIDFYATGVYFNREHDGSRRSIEALLGWLSTRVYPHTGVWTGWEENDRWFEPIRALHRIARGVYGQFDVPLPYPEAAIDTVAGHARDHGWFLERERTAQNVMDVVRVLHLAARQTDHRRRELRDALAAVLVDTVERWVPGEGFADTPTGTPGLRATETWLATVHLIADYLGLADGLSWKPRGLHRPGPASSARVEL